MKRPKSHDRPVASERPAFETTHWSRILAARDRGTAQAEHALSALCAAYWYPLYAFIRRRGHDPDRAADLTQGFFARFLEKDDLESVDRSTGRFRAFLLAACKHFLANAHDREVAAKRGGGRRTVSIDRRDAEGRYLYEPAHDVTPERLFERRWALTLLDRALDQVGREFHRGGKGVLFDRLKLVLTGAEGAAPYAQIGAGLGMTEDAVKKAAQRLKQRYRQILRELVAETVAEPGQVDDEIRALFAILAS
jgi:DNA-directed RNA polymerase specialized sigma24 family protein